MATATKRLGFVLIPRRMLVDADEPAKWILSIVERFGVGPWLVSFDGFGSDPREIWQIPECVAACREFIKLDVLRFIPPHRAWVFFKVANGMYVRGTTTAMFSDSEIDEFMVLMGGDPADWNIE